MLTLAFDTATAVATSALVRDGEVLGEYFAVGLPQLPEQVRRALDVGEEEGDGPDRELGHP